MAARICCLDLDTFFVSVERLLDPTLVGKPVIVGHTGGRGVVTSCSYEVRGAGVRAGMPMAEALRRAPGAIVVPARHDTYGPYAKRVREVLERACPVVQVASIDEFFLDFHGCESLYRRKGDADDDATTLRVVRAMRAAVQHEVELPASCGIGSTRAIAKMGSGLAKPAGVKMVREGEELTFVEALPVRKYPGIGPVAEARLVAAGITTLGLLLRSGDPLGEMVRAGIGGTTVLGRDRPAFHEHDPEGLTDGSISHEHTFAADVGQAQKALDELGALVERVTWRARRRGVRARTITLKLRYADFETISRSRTGRPTDAEGDVLAVARALLGETWVGQRRIRLLGVALSHLERGPRQVQLPFRRERPGAGTAIDAVRARFGYDAIRIGHV